MSRKTECRNKTGWKVSNDKSPVFVLPWNASEITSGVYLDNETRIPFLFKHWNWKYANSKINSRVRWKTSALEADNDNSKRNGDPDWPASENTRNKTRKENDHRRGWRFVDEKLAVKRFSWLVEWIQLESVLSLGLIT